MISRSKPHIHPVEVMPVLPDSNMWKYPCAQVIISKECHFPQVAQSNAGLEISLDPQEFSSALTKIVADSSFLENMGSNARTMVTESYSWNTVGVGFKEIYEQIRTK